jgi:putative oxidoreductase
MERILGRVAPYLYALMRVAVGLLFACHGAQKLFGLFGGPQMPLMSKFGLAGVIEFFGGLMIALGFLTGTVAFIASGEMVYAYFTAHMPRGNVPIQNGGELALLYCFVFLYIAARGVGVWGVDKRTRL